MSYVWNVCAALFLLAALAACESVDRDRELQPASPSEEAQSRGTAEGMGTSATTGAGATREDEAPAGSAETQQGGTGPGSSANTRGR